MQKIPFGMNIVCRGFWVLRLRDKCTKGGWLDLGFSKQRCESVKRSPCHKKEPAQKKSSPKKLQKNFCNLQLFTPRQVRAIYASTFEQTCDLEKRMAFPHTVRLPETQEVCRFRLKMLVRACKPLPICLIQFASFRGSKIRFLFVCANFPNSSLSMNVTDTAEKVTGVKLFTKTGGGNARIWMFSRCQGGRALCKQNLAFCESRP